MKTFSHLKPQKMILLILRLLSQFNANLNALKDSAIQHHGVNDKTKVRECLSLVMLMNFKTAYIEILGRSFVFGWYTQQFL